MLKLDNTMRKIIVVGIFFLSLILATSSFAFRCGEYGNNLASTGMTKQKILIDCGVPISKNYLNKYNKRKKYRMVEEWIYITEKWGKKQVHAIRFNRNGVVVEVEWLGEQK